ncbi:MAG: hypothetical protein HY831_01355 [Candidatus Aenigmarchaeota archaeon]|nr:hypothetical protein [Candidatus Aenigmarchaeota archaeon]
MRLGKFLKTAIPVALAYVAINAWNKYQKCLLVDYSGQIPKIPISEQTYETFETRTRKIQFEPSFQIRYIPKETISVLDNAGNRANLQEELVGRYYIPN